MEGKHKESVGGCQAQPNLSVDSVILGPFYFDIRYYIRAVLLRTRVCRYSQGAASP